ncbi:MAG: hypothetical protein HQK52_12260 [Oligoflexia bacterium]|nr:hypothetical protein [Oligoflexia bacterium]
MPKEEKVLLNQGGSMGHWDRKSVALLLLLFMPLMLTACLNNDERLKARPSSKFSSGSEGDELPGTPTADATGTPDAMVRPSDAIYVDKGFCSCLKGKADIINNCNNYCAGKNVDAPTLYGQVTLSPEVELNFGSLAAWCTQEISTEKINPSCKLEAYDGFETKYLELTIPPGSNSFTANINVLDKYKTYVLAIVESGSGSNARTQSFQVRRVDPEDATASEGPLWISPVHMYSCIYRASTVDQTVGRVIDGAYRDYYFYPDHTLPPAMPWGQTTVYCQNITRYGEEDRIEYPRMELIENILNVWSEKDLRFYDIDQDKKLDINKYIETRLFKEYDLTADIKIFAELPWPNAPTVTASSNGTPASGGSSSNPTVPRLGFYMTPWINPTTKRGYCPTQSDYNSPISNPVFKVLREVVGVDTEAFYYGVHASEQLMDRAGNRYSTPEVRMLIRESLLKQIWFYLDNGRPTEPDSNAVETKTIMYHWPPDVNSPYVRTSSQKLFTITDGQSNASGSMRTSVSPTDKRIGCIPSLGQ